MQAKTTPKQRFKKRRGVALLMVLATLAILTTMTTQFVHETQVRSQIAANARDSVRAYFPARSGTELTRLLIGFMKQKPCPMSMGLGTLAKGSSGGQATCEDELRGLQSALNLPPQPFWRMLPLDSGLFGAIGDGSMGQMLGLPTPKLTTAAIDPQSGALTNEEEGDGPGGEGQALLANLGGTFSVFIDDEDRKIPLKQLWKGTPAQNRAAALRLAALISSPRYDGLFQATNARGEDVDRRELISTILDWMDPDTSISEIDFISGQRITGAQSEDSRYDKDATPYRSKNASFDSIAELKQLKGFTDEVYAAFADQMTIYGENRINVESLLGSLLGVGSLNPDQGDSPSAPVQFLTAVSVCLAPEQILQVGERLNLWYLAFNRCVAARLTDLPEIQALCPLNETPGLTPFDNYFVNVMAQLTAAEGLDFDSKACEESVSNTSRYFKITSQATVGRAARTLTLVLRYAPSDAAEERYYWREE
ncbi:MAG: hypothetical protein VX405_06460 [Myxococcota bacterium]|nr:hypothetical protein [Myxococcota bacterium]